ncbi:MAG: glycosyltransferase family protein [bacterium]
MARRVLFYSHDTLGLGHIRRCLAIASSLASRIEDVSILIVSASSAAGSFHLPPGVDILKIPSIRKLGNGRYASRSLDGSSDDVRNLRAGILRETLRAFTPDVIYVDKDPLGPLGELSEILEENRAARALGEGAITLLGLRDILDDPEAVCREWEARGTIRAIDKLYDRVLVYGMREVYDLGLEYNFPESLLNKMEYVGYIDPRERDGEGHVSVGWDGGRRRVVVTAGGGEDGFALFSSYLRAARILEKRFSLESTIVLGPDFPAASAEAVDLLASELAHPVYVVRFAEEMAHYVRAADLVVSMAGYNTVSEILAYGKKAVVVPRVQPRREQLLRAERLASRGLVSFVHPDALTVQSFSDALAKALAEGVEPRPHAGVDLGGLDRTALLVAEILNAARDEGAASIDLSDSARCHEVIARSAAERAHVR